MTTRKYCLALTIAAMASFVPPQIAHAADLGGDCCADLEERIAELEVTSARKGNRKLSLTVTGYVAQEITYWNDGKEQNTYIHGLGPTQATNVNFVGDAAITRDFSAGYFIGILDLTSNPIARAGTEAIDQNNARFGTGLDINFAWVQMESKSLGKVRAGFLPPAAKGAAMFTDESGTMLIENYTFFAGMPQFYLRNAGTLDPSMTWGNMTFCYWQNLPIGGDCSGIAMNAVRYDTPTLGGFNASVSWGEDDAWQVATRYSGVHHGIKVSLGLGYSVSTAESVTGPRVLERKDSSYLQVGGYLEHTRSGLFLHGAYGEEDNNGAVLLASGIPVLDGSHWYVKSGVRKAWTSLGATIVFADYAAYLDQIGPAALAQGATSSKMQRFGAGIAQEIDAAAMTLYLKYQRYDGEMDGVATLTDIDALDLVSGGAVINF